MGKGMVWLNTAPRLLSPISCLLPLSLLVFWTLSLSPHREMQRQRRLTKPGALQRLQRLNKMQMHYAAVAACMELGAWGME